MSTLRWIEPFGRDTDEIYRSYDTGLCNRLFFWEIAQEINKLHGNKFKILLQQTHYPELLELLDLPNTILIKEDVEVEQSINLLNFKNLDLEGTDKIESKPINKDLLDEILLSKKQIQSSENWYSDFGFTRLDDIFSDSEQFKRHIKDIKIKDKNLEKILKDFTSNMIGIHVRRGRGVHFKNNLHEINDGIKNEFIKFREKESAESFYQFDFYDDTFYFKIIDSILEINENQKFYISYDGPDNLIDYWFEKYPNNLHRKNDYLKYIKNDIFSDSHFKNVIDLFSLCFCSFLIKFPLSTWSNFADTYLDKKSVILNEPKEKIIEKYKKHFKK
jgi:hypothetical protein